jgi:hypothetical protein
MRILGTPVFEATNPEDGKRLNDEAKLPYFRIVEALDPTR